MRFHLIDRIDSWEPRRRITARKLTSRAEDYWRGDPAGRVWMPPELVLESVCQAATWLVMLGSGFAQRAVLLSVDEATWSGPVVPGDVLTVAATITTMTGEAARVDGVADVDGQVVLCTTGILCALQDADTLDARENAERLARQLLRTGEEP